MQFIMHVVVSFEQNSPERRRKNTKIYVKVTRLEKVATQYTKFVYMHLVQEFQKPPLERP
jgi:hypothetical protein